MQLTTVQTEDTLVGENVDVAALGTASRRLRGRRERSPQYRARLAEAYKIYGAALTGDRRAAITLEEKFSTSDFPILFGDILDRQLLAEYKEVPSVWRQFARSTPVVDFRPKKLIDFFGGKGALEDVPELSPYPARAKSEADYELTVKKKGARFGISWESRINDDLDGLSRLPEDLARAARYTEDRLATSLIAGTSGPNSAFFNGGNGNQLSGNPALTIDSLEAALTHVGNRRDPDGNPIFVDSYLLVVPRALKVTADQILAAREVRIVQGTNELLTNNWATGSFTSVVNPWLDVISTSNGATSWYVLPAPSSDRPAVTLGFLRGHEVPDLRQAWSNSQRVGGGDVPADEGSFDDDSIQYRVRHVVGGTTIDPIATVASNGTGS